MVPALQADILLLSHQGNPSVRSLVFNIYTGHTIITTVIPEWGDFIFKALVNFKIQMSRRLPEFLSRTWHMSKDV